MTKFKLSEIQAGAILEMQLRRLAALEREKIIDEYNQILTTIADYKAILSTPTRVTEIIRTELTEMKEIYGDKRRTKVHRGKPGEISDEELIKEEETVVLLTRGGYIKRVSPLSFKTQNRGGKGVSGGNLKEEDVVQLIITANTHDQILFFTTRGRVFVKRVWDLPESSRIARGTPIVNFIGIDQGERITSILTKNSKPGTN